MKLFSRICFLLSFCFLSGLTAYAAPPPNDDCTNATVIPISAGGFGLGVFTSPTTDITDATIQFGEPFYSSQITAGNDKKTVWYKFTLITNRGVNIELKQPGVLIPLNAAGFTLYKAPSCMPALTDIPPAKLTPLNQFGSSYNPCLNSGDYYVQISARLASNGPIFIELTTSMPGVLNEHDLKSTRHPFGVISGGWVEKLYDVGCQTIDNIGETCTALGALAPDYAQSTWLTFTTDAYVDLVRLELGEMINTNGGHKVGYNIYQGDCFTNPSGLVLVDGCNVTQQNNFTTGDPRFYWTGKNYTCFFLPNTTYTIQVFYNKGYINTVGVRLYETGVAPTDAPIPTALGTAPGNTNALGALPSNGGAGVTTNGTDYLSCNARIINNACGTVNPATGVVTSAASAGNNYKLDTWYTFTITNSSNVTITTPPNLLKRLYTGNVFTNCNLSPSTDFTTSSYPINCMAAGTYSIQLLGMVDTTGRNFLNYYQNQLSSPATISINVQKLQALNLYSLTDATLTLGNARVWKYNGFAPLANGVTYTGAPDTLGCLNTVLPSNMPCPVGNTKAIYREITIGSNGILTLSGGNYYFQYTLYRGDAQVLANAQNAFATGQTITGLQDLTGCQDLYFSNPRVCVTPGVYTLVSFGDQSDVGIRDLPSVRFDPAVTLFSVPTAPNNLGTIAVFPASGTVDTWSCVDNPLTISGQAPCGGATKQIYREFFIATPQYINVYNSGYQFRLFTGQVSLGTQNPNIPGYGNIGCVTSFNADINTCAPRILPAGWYTAVVYATGGIYAGPNFINGAIGLTTNISITLTAPPVIPAPIYNRPYKAYVANAGAPIVWGPNAGTAAIPQTARTYTFGTEFFNCQNDLPFSAHPVTGCAPADNRVAYYVFTLNQESYVNFSGIPNGLRCKIFNLNVRTADSLLMPTATPIQTCISRTSLNYDNLGWNGDIEICRMQPGTYTLVVFATDAQINSTCTPIAYIEKVESSRFDHANNAYDFANMPGDNVQRFGKVGDVNPLNAGRTASNDFFTCTAGAQPTDPANVCWDGSYQNGIGTQTVPYPMPINHMHYQGATTNLPVRRNLWYTFTVTGPGLVTVNVNNLTPNRLTQYPYTIYKSNVNGLTPFSTVVSNGDVDSTFLQGLTLVSTTNPQNLNGNSNIGYYGCVSNDAQRSFVRDECLGVVTDRYYILVDHHSHLELNSQVDVGITFQSTPVQPVLYDYYSTANLINGLNQTAPVYTPVTLSNGTFTGATGYFSCATNSIPDPAACDPKSLWYKIVVGATGKIKINFTTTLAGVATTAWNAANMQLYRQLIPGDSTTAGLMPIPLTAITNSGMPWGEACMNPGTYYILLTGCNFTIETVVPRVMLTGQSGDFCSDPVAFSVTNAGTANASVNVDCHTMEPDYGEDGSNMGCLFGPTGYKSTWYKVTVNSALKMDVSFQLSEFTTAFPNQIRYRVLFGTCGAMTAGPCNTDALTQFTLNCMPIGTTDYYIQIVTPITAIGNINLAVTTTVSPDQTCLPVNPTIPTANFTVGPACNNEAVQFSNQSTLGASISYLWTFGSGGATSTALSPSFTYPNVNAITTYNVTLLVTNTALGTTNSTTIPVVIYPKPVCNITRDAPNNGAIVQAGVPIQFHANATNTIASPVTSYLWTFGNGQTSTSANPLITFNSYGTFNVTLVVSNGTCTSICTTTLTTVSESVFGGGVNDGASIILIAAVCPVPQIFAGGINDGASILLIASSCPIPAIFSGGINDGASILTINASCPPPAIFAGGINDGASIFTIASSCPPPAIFAGGINDGASILTIASSCPPPAIFAGGINDGANILLIASSCPPPAIFAGGINDGASILVIASSCPVPQIFAGGINDGASILTIASSCPVPQIFAGGINDGASLFTIVAPCPVPQIFAGGIKDGASITFQLRDPMNCLIALPIQLLNFNVQCLNSDTEGNKAAISWITASEQSNLYFTLERSDDGVSWYAVTTINGAINSVENINYTVVDETPIRSVVYYRLKQTDFNGKFTTNNPIALNGCENAETGITVFPNPTNGAISIEITSVSSTIETREVVIYNVLGQVVGNQQLLVNKGLNSFTVDLDNQPPGMYSFVFSGGANERATLIKVVKL
jgi:PKD repeat protein